MLSDVISRAPRGFTFDLRRPSDPAALYYDRGLVVNRKLIRRIMVEQGLSGLPTRRRPRRNLANVATAEDLVNRNFCATVDVTEHSTREG